MKKRAYGLAVILIFGMVTAGICTGILYRCFPQFLCYAVYDVCASDLYQREDRLMEPGSSLVEAFVPRYPYLTGIRIQVDRAGSGDHGNVIIGRLLDPGRKTLAESRFAPEDAFFEFRFDRWVRVGEEYRLEVIFPEENKTAVPTTFGPKDIGPEEHRALYIDGEKAGQAVYAEYIYGTYSKKLLAFWFFVFFLGGTLLGDTVWSRLIIGKV